MTVVESTFVDAVARAEAAPSPRDTRPWRFCHDPATGAVQVRRSLTSVDVGGWEARVALGAATYNLRLAFAVAGQPMALSWLPENTDPDLHALLVPGPVAPPTAEQRRLARAIPRRHSHRAPFRPEPVPAQARTAILRAAREEAAWLELVTGVAPVAAIAGLTRTAQQVLEREPGYRGEARWVPEDLHDLFPLAAVLGTVGDLPVDHLRAGYALQRVLLTITDLGLCCSMFSQAIEVPSAREQLRISLGRHGAPQMVLRIGYGEPGHSRARGSKVPSGVDLRH